MLISCFFQALLAPKAKKDPRWSERKANVWGTNLANFVPAAKTENDPNKLHHCTALRSATPFPRSGRFLVSLLETFTPPVTCWLAIYD